MDAMQKFLEYASAYDDGSDTRIKLKIIHTQRVTEVMEQLTARAYFGTRQKLAYLCAVYHDIGRFEQLKRYHTFLDYKSIDHAQLGCEILRQGDFLDELSAREREQVLTAIVNHNRLTIEDGLDEKTLLFAKLIRDADKCDIFRVFAQENPVDTTVFPQSRWARKQFQMWYMRAFWVITASKTGTKNRAGCLGQLFLAFSLI